MGQNWGGCVPFLGELGPHLKQCGLVEAYLLTKWQLDPSSRLATIHGPRSAGAAVPPFWGDGSPSNTMSPGLGPTSMPSFILIHPTVWPQYTNVTDRQDRRDRQTTDRYHRANRFQTVAQRAIQSYDCMYPSGKDPAYSGPIRLRPFYSRPIALTEEGRNLVNDVCECVRD